MSLFDEDRSKYPPIGPDGKAIFDLNSGKYTKIWQGPQHPGITGNMSMELTITGEEVVEAKTHVGYLHRGFEKLMERRRYMQCFPIVCRICVPEPDTNEYCFATAVENLSNIVIPEKAKWLRTLVLEMSRLTNFVQWLGGQGSSLGMTTPGQWTYYLRDLILDRFEELSGGRVYHMYIIPGGVRGDLPEGFATRLENTLQEIEKVLKELDDLIFTNAVFKKRTVGIATIKREWVDDYGIVGPNARSVGVKRDIRKDHPYLVYPQLDFDIVSSDKKESDIYDRAKMRRGEIDLSIALIRQIMAKMPKNEKEIMSEIPSPLHWKVPRGEIYVRAESTRGEYGYYLASDGSEYPRRVQIRGPSYTHALVLLEKMLVGANLSDVFATMVSLQVCPPEIER